MCLLKYEHLILQAQSVMLSDCTMRKRTLAKRAPFGLTGQRVSVGDALGERAVEQLLLLLLLRPDHRGHTVTHPFQVHVNEES